MYLQIPKNQLEEVKSTLVNSYVDDISVNITVADIHKELNTPTLLMDPKKHLNVYQSQNKLHY